MTRTIAIVLGLFIAENSLACSPYDKDCKRSEQLYEQCLDLQPIPVCHIEDYERADLKLNRVYKELKAKLLLSEFKKVQKEQRNWLKSMNKECQCTDCLNQGPVFECKASLTWKRALQLQSELPY